MCESTQRAAAFAYYTFFSLFPLAVLAVAVGSMFVEREVAIDTLIRHAERYVPLTGAMERQVFATISGVADTRGEVGVAASLVPIWGAMRFFKALVRAPAGRVVADGASPATNSHSIDGKPADGRAMRSCL